MPSDKKFDYRIRIQVREESPDGVLLDCLKNERHPTYSHKEMLLWALRAYWLPIAYELQQESGKQLWSEHHLKRMALDSIHQLRQQIAYLESVFDVGQKETPYANQVVLDRPMANGDAVSGRMPPLAASQSATNQTQESWFDSDDLFDSRID